MSRALEEFLLDPTSAEKELTRKLYWAITSTLQLSRDQRSSTFSWVADLAIKVVQRHSATPPSASRFKTPGHPTLAPKGNKHYDGQAEGGVAGSFETEPEGRPPFRTRHSRPTSSPETDPARLAAFRAEQASEMVKAVAYMVGENVRLGVRKTALVGGVRSSWVH